MKVIKPSVEFVNEVNGKLILQQIERAGRVCYKSEDKITDGSAEKFVKHVIDRGHLAVLEHANITVKFVVDRGVSHEIVRHRIAAYCQESTRYCNYTKEGFGKEITVIKPCFFEKHTTDYILWYDTCKFAEEIYFDLIAYGRTPQEARSILPNSLKTEVIMTADLREWRHFLQLRTSKAAHPQMREVAIPLLEMCKKAVPIVFDDIILE